MYVTPIFSPLRGTTSPQWAKGSSLPRLHDHIQTSHNVFIYNIYIICYAHDAVLIADSAENLQTLLLIFDQIAESLNMEISLSKTKSLTISQNNIKCEIKLKDTTIEQVSKFTYLGVEISAKTDLKQEVIS